MVRVHSFEPVIGDQPRVLILGSMPGVASLDAVQYYAHPRNAFWRILQQLFTVDFECDYEQRIDRVRKLPIILWDTLKSCHREGSLDSRIEKQGIEANDIPALLNREKDIRAIAFNGATSEKYFLRLVKPQIDKSSKVELLKLPSTSPANAGFSFEEKLAQWQKILNYI